MIITRTPLRISFCGGGSDLPDYYRKNGGCVLSTSINKYIYITLTRSFHKDTTQLKYSVVESVKDVNAIKHPIFREVLKEYNMSGVEINSTSDVPSGTGLGSSSSFTVGLINSARVLCRKDVTKELLANEACDIEINRLGEPIGKQDQYAAAYGDLNFIKFNKDETVDVEPVEMTEQDKKLMSDNLLMFYLGGTRSASKILEKYSSDTKSSVDKKKSLCDLTEKLKYELDKGNVDALGKILDEGWKIKKTLAQGISTGIIDDVYEKAINSGAVGGKLLGAGGNGFMLFYVDGPEQKAVREALSDYREMDFRFDTAGSRVVYNDDM